MLRTVQYSIIMASTIPMRPKIAKIIEMCDPDRFQIHKFFTLFLAAKPTKEELKFIVDKLPEEEDRLMTDAIDLRLWDFALLMAKRDFLRHENDWEDEIEDAHEDDNMPCHLLMSHFGFPKGCSSFEYPTCKLCKKLETKYIRREEDFATSSDESSSDESSDEEESSQKRKRASSDEKAPKRKKTIEYKSI